MGMPLPLYLYIIYKRIGGNNTRGWAGRRAGTQKTAPVAKIDKIGLIK
jgi:hypothetical protein